MQIFPRPAFSIQLFSALLATPLFASAETDWLRTQLSSNRPDQEVLRLDIDGDDQPDILERWWNGKRVRWLDENGDLRPGDLRGDQIADVLQIDFDGDGFYDGHSDINVKWADLDANGIPDMQAFVLNPTPNRPGDYWALGQWMILRNFDDRGVLGWMDWSTFDFDCWGYTEEWNWLPNYHGDTLFLKAHIGVSQLTDPTLNWENPFSFYDLDDDGLSEMTIRWADSLNRRDDGSVAPDARIELGHISYDLDNDSGRGNETDFDMTLSGRDRDGMDYSNMVHPVSGFVGDPKFDACFRENNWRRIDALRYVRYEDSYDLFFTADWTQMHFVFDEDDDDHRWERVEMYQPHARRGPGPADTHTVLRRNDTGPDRGVTGISANPQADSLGDRGEFDEDNSGRGKLYIGVFDRKLHLFGAEWGAWLVDAEAQFHGGRFAPTSRPDAPHVEEVVKYTDIDGNGFLDTIEYDYDGDRTVDLRVCLLDYATDDNPNPDVVETLDTQALGWQGLHETFNKIAEDAWVEALSVYRAAWRRGLTTPEHDLLAFASSKAERYAEAYWLKEKLFRHFRTHLATLRKANPASAKTLTQLEADLTRLYYTGNFNAYIDHIATIPTN